VKLDNVTREDWIVSGLALVLVIDLIFFPWFHISVGAGPFTVTADFSGTGTPDGWLGVLAVLAALAVIGDLAIERLSPQTTVPAIGNSRTMTRFVLAVIAAGFMALKFLLHIHFSLFGWGFYAGVILAAALVYFATQARQTEPAVVPRPTGPPAPPPAAAAPPPPASEPPPSSGPPSS
jgi:hypothetical protein